MPTPIVMAGYQGETSILTASLRVLAQGLETAGWDGAVELMPDVTRTGERAAELFASLEGGSRHLGYMASGYLSHRVPELDVLNLPFAVADRAQALAALDGAAGQLLRQAVERATGLRVLAFWDNGFRHVSNALRPLRTPADCQGLVIRTLDSAAYREALAALGFQPMTTDVKDLVRVVEQAIKLTAQDFRVIEGLRTQSRQRYLVDKGASKTMNSRHITGHAVDLAPIINGAVSWDWKYFYPIAEAMKHAAKIQGVTVEWGGDWTSFKDGPHWQLPRGKYP